MDTQTKLIATAIIGATGVGLTFARRWGNSRDDAGYGSAGWTIFILFLMWC